MELKVESRIGTVLRNAEQIGEFLSDFNRLGAFVPPDKVQDWQVTADTCSFSVAPVGSIAFRVLERRSDTVKMAVDTVHAKEVYMWIQFKPTQPYETKIKLTIKADVNPMMKMFLNKPLQEFLNKLMDSLEKI